MLYTEIAGGSSIIRSDGKRKNQSNNKDNDIY